MKQARHAIEAIIVNCRWLVAPFLLGLVVGLAVLLCQFVVKLVQFAAQMGTATPADVIVGMLNLVDLTLIANLVVVVICSSYENFLAPIDLGRHPQWPPGLHKIGFSGLKQKVLGSIVAIAAVNVLEWFVDIDRAADNAKLAWIVGMLMAFALALLILAIADRSPTERGH